jgi:hypothetical protein
MKTLAALTSMIALLLNLPSSFASQVKKLKETAECLKDPKSSLSKKTKCIDGPKPAAAAAVQNAAEFDPASIPGAPQLKSKFFKK